MIAMSCEQIRHLVPDEAGGRLDAARSRAVSEHAATCTECASELALARLLFAARVDAPPDLAERIVAATRLERRREQGTGGRVPAYGYRPWWGVAAAGLAALAVGIGVRTSGAPGGPVQAPVYAREIEEAGPWISEDGLLAGAPALEDLSEEVLRRLLEELSTVNGGAV